MAIATENKEVGRVVLNGLGKRFGDVEAVDGISAEIEPGSFFALLGPSGCGKSTLLRMIAGLEDPTAGSIAIDGRDVTALSARHRPTAMVFQSYALFPSMTVAENVEYGLRVRGAGKLDRAHRVGQALERVGMAALKDRAVTALSGGQQQRVALARALVVEPAVMLFDEPLSNLDVALREKTRGELKTLQAALGTTSIYVTHDQEEAMAVADRMAVMRQGSFVQVGTPRELFERPQTAYVAAFLGGSNIIRKKELVGRLAPLAADPPSRPDKVLSLRPADFRVAPDGEIRCRISSRQYLGAHTEWVADWAGTTLRIRMPSSVSLEEETVLTPTALRWVADDMGASSSQ